MASPFDELIPTFAQKYGAKASDKLTEGALWLYDKLADRDKLSAAHRIYLDTFARDRRDPITNTDFSAAELAELQNLIRQKEILTGGRGKGYVQYEDYRKLPGGDRTKAAEANVVTGGLPPRPSLSNAIGQFNYRLDPKTGQYVIADEYDFNPQRVEYEGKMHEVPSDFYGDYVADHVTSLYDVARLYGGRKMPPGTGRKINIQVPVAKARGGLAQYKECSCHG